MKYLIDTMVLSEPTKRKQDANVIHWFSLHRHECAVSVLTLGEVERGITKMKDSNRKHRLMAWFNTSQMAWRRQAASCRWIGRS